MRFVVYNPRSGSGRTGRNWSAIARRIEAATGSFEAAATGARDDATRLVREAVAQGAREVVAVGGDGTISEAINGLFRPDLTMAPDVTFGFVTSGTGGDLRRTFGIEAGIEAACTRLASGATRRVDLGRLTFIDGAGRRTVRHFGNIASLGLSGATAQAVNEAGASRVLPAKALFRYHSLATLLRYRFQGVRLTVDGTQIESGPIATVVVANGRYFGGGMRIAPNADPQDGELDVVVVRGRSKRELVSAMNLVYQGAHVAHPAVRVARGRRIEAEPLDDRATGPVLLDVDGEAPGRLPATFEVLPSILTLRC